ncbi:AraC family transcriptional regulator [Ruminococcaceae bacterium OttesenSCG-928-N02]|nr:AraC family transcriptional regulator [Ruminococcaceae bacterium OttesenSCG-928-N02]
MSKANAPIHFMDFGDVEIVCGTVSHNFPVHIHRATCYGVITQGSAVFYCEGKQAHLKEGDCFFVPSGAPHTLLSVGGAVYSYCTFCVKHKTAPFDGDVFLQRVYNYMQRETGKRLNLAEMARHIGYSKYHAAHLFKEKAGLAPYRYHAALRVAAVKRALQSDANLLDLVHRYGFSDQSHLCNTFKKHMGLSPLQYKKAYHAYASAGEKVAKI